MMMCKQISNNGAPVVANMDTIKAFVIKIQIYEQNTMLRRKEPEFPRLKMRKCYLVKQMFLPHSFWRSVVFKKKLKKIY